MSRGEGSEVYTESNPRKRKKKKRVNPEAGDNDWNDLSRP